MGPWVRGFVHIVAVAVAAAVGAGADDSIVYITDLTEFSALAPCAASAISFVVQGLSETACPPAVTALESCACTKNGNSGAIATSLNSSVLYNCGATASEDVTSASAVFNRYCHQDAVASPASVPTAVSEYITDLPAFSALAPCASSALSSAVMTLTYELCPDAAPVLASCACIKNQNSLAASERINSGVSEECGSTNSEDITSAQAVFSGYCGLNTGVTSFPTPSPLPGQVSYYITDMPAYSSLTPCAGSAVSYAVQSLTNDLCPPDPLFLASCACVKDNNSQGISNTIVSYVREYCGTTDQADITSALNMFGGYCSAAKGLVTPTGIKVSVANANYGSIGGNSAQQGSAARNTGSATSTNVSGSNNPSPTKKSNTGLIAGIVGGIAGVLVICGIALFFWIRQKRRNSLKSAQTGTTGPGDISDTQDKSELPASSPSDAEKKPISSPTEDYVSGVTSPFLPQDTKGEVSELYGHREPGEASELLNPSQHSPHRERTPELPGQHHWPTQPPVAPAASGLYANNGHGPYEMPGSRQW